MPSGIELKLAARKATTWGTAVACGAMDGILMLPGTLKRSRDSKIDDSLGLFWPTGDGVLAGADGAGRVRR